MITTIEMLVLMQFMLLAQLSLTVHCSAKRPKLSSDQLPPAVVPVAAIMVPKSQSVNKVLRANGCTQSSQRVVSTSGTLRSIIEKPPPRRKPMAGPHLMEKAKGMAEKVAEREKAKEKEVVKEKERMMERATTKERVKPKVKVAEVEVKAKVPIATDARSVVRPGESIPGSQVVGMCTARDPALMMGKGLFLT